MMVVTAKMRYYLISGMPYQVLPLELVINSSIIHNLSIMFGLYLQVIL